MRDTYIPISCITLIAICRASTVSRIRDLDRISVSLISVASAVAAITALIISAFVIINVLNTDAAQTMAQRPALRIYTHSLSRYNVGKPYDAKRCVVGFIR